MITEYSYAEIKFGDAQPEGFQLGQMSVAVTFTDGTRFYVSAKREYGEYYAEQFSREKYNKVVDLIEKFNKSEGAILIHNKDGDTDWTITVDELNRCYREMKLSRVGI